MERALDRALSDVEVRIDPTSARDFENALQQVERSVDLINNDLDAIETSSGVSEANFREIAQALGISEDRASELAGEILESQSAANRVEAAARDIARQLGLSEDEARRFTSALARADTEAKEVADSTQRISGGFATLRSNALGLIAGFGAFAAIRSAVRFAGEARDAFATLQDSANAVNVVFGEAASTINEFGQSVAQSAGLSTAEFNQAASVLGSALLNVGFGAEEAADKTVILTQRAADMASVFGGEVSVALGAIQAALRGEVDPIERFGVGLNAAAVEARAAALGFQVVDGELSNTAKAAARLDLILEQTARTSGDFANTSGDLANATKIAAAEFENAKAAVGEALLPVFQTLLDAAPQILDAIIDLTPALQDLAQGFADLLTSKQGMLDFVDILNTLFDLPRGFGQIGDGIRLLVEGAGTAGSVLERLLNRDFAGAIEAAKDGLAGLGDEAQRSLERVNTQGLVDDLRQGEDAALALANRLAEVGRKGKLDPNFIRDLSKIAGTDLRQTALALQTVVNGAAALDLGTDEVMNLNVALAQLASLGESSEADRIAARNRDIADTAPLAASAMDLVTISAAEAGLSIADLLAGVDPLAQTLLESLTPSEQFALRLEAIRTGSLTAAEAFTTNLLPAIVDIEEGLGDLNDTSRISLDQFTANLTAAAQDFLNFMVNIAAIAAISPELAAALQQLPEDVRNELAANFAQADPAEIIAAAEALTGPPEAVAGAILAIYVRALGQVDARDPRAVTNLINNLKDTLEAIKPGATAIFAAGFQPALNASFADLDPPDLTPVLVASVEGMNSEAITASLDDALFASFADLEFPDTTAQMTRSIDGWSAAEIARAVETRFEGIDFNIDFTDEGVEAGITLVDGMAIGVSSSAAQDRLRDSVVDAVNNALENQSPSHLMLRMGEDAGDAFWSGFDQAMVSTVELPTVQIPDIVIPDIALPDVTLPEVEIPPVTIPDIAIPEILIPTPQIEDISLPDVLLPDITIPAVDITAIDLTSTGVDAGASLIVGVTTGIASEVERLHVAIENATNAALEARSPSQLMLRLGEAAGTDFWTGFDQAELTLKTPTAAFTGSIISSTAAANVMQDGGFTFAPTYVNTETKDLETVVARSEQTMAAVSGLLGKIKLA